MEWIFQNKFVRKANFSPALVLTVVSVGLSFPLQCLIAILKLLVHLILLCHM